MNRQVSSNAASDIGVVPITTGATGTSGGFVTYAVSDLLPFSPAGMKALENAVYGHIRAVRALGRTQVLASEIATALSLPVSDVVKAQKPALQGRENRRMNRQFSFPLREVSGEKWCSLANMGIKRIDVVAYSFDVQNKFTFAGGHRHRRAVVRDDIHLLFPTEDVTVDIAAVPPSSTPSTPKRRHHKGR
jgi:hypothetical protein